MNHIMKNPLKFFLFSTLMLICSLAHAQSNADFQGSWTGVDKDGKSVDLQLNASMTCVLKINGSVVYNISAYRIYDGKAVADPDATGPKRGIVFYTNTNATVSSGLNSMSSTTPAVTTYEGNMEITDLSLFKTMHLSFAISPTSQQLDFDLSK